MTDACFGGSIFGEYTQKRRVVTPKMLDQLYSNKSRFALTSGALETVPDESIFIEHFLKRLESNRESWMIADRLFADIQDSMVVDSREAPVPKYGIIKDLGNQEGGAFVFLRREVSELPQTNGGAKAQPQSDKEQARLSDFKNIDSRIRRWAGILAVFFMSAAILLTWWFIIVIKSNEVQVEKIDASVSGLTRQETNPDGRTWWSFMLTLENTGTETINDSSNVFKRIEVCSRDPHRDNHGEHPTILLATPDSVPNLDFASTRNNVLQINISEFEPGESRTQEVRVLTPNSLLSGVFLYDPNRYFTVAALPDNYLERCQNNH